MAFCLLWHVTDGFVYVDEADMKHIVGLSRFIGFPVPARSAWIYRDHCVLASLPW